MKEIRADYPFEVKVAKPFKRPTQSGGTDASVFAVEGVPTFGFNTQDIKDIISLMGKYGIRNVIFIRRIYQNTKSMQLR